MSVREMLLCKFIAWIGRRIRAIFKSNKHYNNVCANVSNWFQRVNYNFQFMNFVMEWWKRSPKEYDVALLHCRLSIKLTYNKYTLLMAPSPIKLSVLKDCLCCFSRKSSEKFAASAKCQESRKEPRQNWRGQSRQRHINNRSAARICPGCSVR